MAQWLKAFAVQPGDLSWNLRTNIKVERDSIVDLWPSHTCFGTSVYEYTHITCIDTIFKREVMEFSECLCFSLLFNNFFYLPRINISVLNQHCKWWSSLQVALLLPAMSTTGLLPRWESDVQCLKDQALTTVYDKVRVKAWLKFSTVQSLLSGEMTQLVECFCHKHEEQS